MMGRMTSLLRQIALLFTLVSAGTAGAQLGTLSLGGPAKEEPILSSTLTANVDSFKKGESFLVSYELSAKKPWHLYFRNPGSVGYPPGFDIKAPEGFTVEGPYWEVPHRSDSANGFFYGYDAQDVIWKLTPTSDVTEASFTVTSDTQACDDNGCAGPFQLSQTLSLKAGDANPNPQWKGQEKTVEKLGDTPTTVTANTGEGATLLLNFETAEPVETAYFFSENNIIAPHLPQTLTRSGTMNTLSLPINDNSNMLYAIIGDVDPKAPVKELQGILSYGDKHQQVDVEVTAAAPVLATSLPPMPLGFWEIVGFLVIGGFILNLMPCVFPVIGLKIMSFVELSGGSRSKILMHSAAFVFGVLASFWALTLIIIVASKFSIFTSMPWTEWLNALIYDTGASGRSWAEWMQNPWIIYILVLLLLVLGLNMYGMFEFGTSVTGAGQNLQQKKGLSGSFFSGLLATVVATPCSAPFLGSALPAAMSMPAIWMLIAMSGMAIGLALPYIIIGIFPSLIRFLPRPGAWMESLKQALSFLLFGATAWLIVTYIAFVPSTREQDLPIILIGFVVVGCAFWVYGRWCPIYREKRTRIIGGITALAILAGGVIMSIPRKDNGVVWHAWTPEAMQAALDEGKPVFVDYTATWCMTCQSNKQLGYNDAVYKRMQELGIVLMKADKTKPNKDIDAELSRLKRTQIPVNVLYQKDEEPAITDVILRPQYLIDFFDSHVEQEEK